MTEIEQKAEEYFSHHNYALHNRYGVQKDIHRMIYKDGYKQGQKEQNCVHCSNRSSELRKSKLELEKENHQLKNDYEMIDNCYRIVKKENAELKETLQHREHCIDWITENYPEVISKYLERKE